MAGNFIINHCAIHWKSFSTSASPHPLLGAIFNEQYKNSSVETAFKYAVHRINNDKTILPHSQLEYVIKYVEKDDSFHATKEGERKVADYNTHTHTQGSIKSLFIISLFHLQFPSFIYSLLLKFPLLLLLLLHLVAL